MRFTRRIGHTYGTLSRALGILDLAAGMYYAHGSSCHFLTFLFPLIYLFLCSLSLDSCPSRFDMDDVHVTVPTFLSIWIIMNADMVSSFHLR